MQATSDTFRAREAAVLGETFAYALAYLDFGPRLTELERDLLARVTLLAARARRRLGKGLESYVDAHILAAEIVDVFLMLQLVANEDAI